MKTSLLRATFAVVALSCAMAAHAKEWNIDPAKLPMDQANWLQEDDVSLSTVNQIILATMAQEVRVEVIPRKVGMEPMITLRPEADLPIVPIYRDAEAKFILREARARALVTEEKEEPVSSINQLRQGDGAAQGCAKLIAPQDGPRLVAAGRVLVKEVVGVEVGVSQIVIRAPVQHVCSGSRKKGELASRAAAILGGIGRTLDSEFL